jgi:hypothetical protein
MIFFSENPGFDISSLLYLLEFERPATTPLQHVHSCENYLWFYYSAYKAVLLRKIGEKINEFPV